MRREAGGGGVSQSVVSQSARGAAGGLRAALG